MRKNIILGITSGIAAYKCIDLVKLLRGENINVNVIMTQHAAKMVSPLEFEKVTAHKAYTDLFEKDFDYKNILKSRKVDHIELADNADLLVIAPATANIIAKLAHGIADDFLTTTALAVTAPIIICPSMNVNMWNNPVVQENISKLRRNGFQIIEPAIGNLACGYTGAGRLPEVEVIKDRIIEQLFRIKSLDGKKVLVTAGGTAEKIDDVRFITNRSSGKMGAAIADECFLRGAEVMLLRNKSSVTPRYIIKEELFMSADDLLTLVKKYIGGYDYIFHTAAVSDFKVKNNKEGKISSESQTALELTPQTKILDHIKKLNPGIRLIGFKAESGEKNLISKAVSRMRSAKADLMIANDISKKDIGFESDDNEVIIIPANGSIKHLPKDTKRNIAREILDFVNRYFN